jgi:STE24 endopeptidase
MSPALPPEFEGYFDEEKYARSQRYTLEKSNLSLINSTVSIGFIVPFILLGGFNVVDQWVRGFGLASILTGTLFIFFLIVAAGILELPFSIYSTFVLEEKYGFNKTTVRTFILDLVKNVLLLIIIGGPLLALVLWFFQETGKLAPLFIWIVITLFQIFMAFIAPVVIMPMFNKFIPLEEGPLRDAIEDYSRKFKFKMKGIFKIDSSRRSTKANAFFAGFGKSRRIVLYDTLIGKHTDDELLTVLAHEMGHYKLGHILKMMLASVLETGLLLFILALFIKNKELFAAFKMETLSVYASLIFFGFLYSPISLVISLVMNRFSHRYEYDADRYAVRTTKKGEIFITALKKLSVDNLSNLTPHRVKVLLYYSHPPILKRIKAIREQMKFED